MTEPLVTPTSSPPPLPRAKPQAMRTRGGKLIIVCVLAVLMSIPAFLVFGLLMERTNRADTVAREIGGLMGGRQVFMGPVIAVPYTNPGKVAIDAKGNRTVGAPESGTLIVFPATGQATAATKSEVRARSMFRVPVYTSDIAFKARFDLSKVQAALPAATLNWADAQVLSGASDSRGARTDILAKVNGTALTLAPSGYGQQAMAGTGDEGGGSMDLFSTPVSGLTPDQPVDVALNMTFTGAEKIAFLAFAKTTEAKITGDWNFPSFGGGFLPVTRSLPRNPAVAPSQGEQVTKKGFAASWSVPFVARGMPAAVDMSQLSNLGRSELSVTFVEPTNPYQSVGRSLKYALLFIGLVFLTYFLFETTSKRELHPAQYILVGLAQITFYLLLLSLAERIGFDAAFAVAAGATVLLISGYAGLIFSSLWRFIGALGAFSLLYGLIYILMRMEDYALLVGAVSAFLVIAIVMILTRNINWYGREPFGKLSEEN
ncbi:cell envelope integrity protein CreD [Asticcacaulis machinosus]|uniref:Cell envelope integrity protein CreD n=1 Tax=Asticcacaulis machinosus TaxID=2984211 RepID=A0ABT5HKZ0_9CAUL|nr:cell envelope integrity protein CreD [Asticcacaulis machinosus]MDC7676909.1 cell envelope integrity protein CreD [Asticcacaulis machinosus]